MSTRFHISLNVSDLDRSVAFYRLLLGAEPAKLRSDYAKFELEDPPLVLSLEPRAAGDARSGALNHVGFRMEHKATMMEMHARLTKAGLDVPCELGVECCYSRQTKFWAHDPDGTLWEVYTFDGDLEHRGAGQSAEKILAPQMLDLELPEVWSHRLTQPVPERVPHEDASLDEVRLQGTFNAALRKDEQQRLLAEAHRVLRPGGRVFIHVLTAERPIAAKLDLPGPASVVQHAPVDADVVALTEAAGFQGVRMLKFDARPCFVREGVEMRETQLEGWKQPAASKESFTVVYKGPFRELRDDAGNVFPRGQRVPAGALMAERLRAPEWASHFLVLDGSRAGTTP